MNERTQHRDGLLCALLVGACILVAQPFAEMGFIDDWSYIKTAQVFASTGHLVYNGWAAAMLGWQIPLGALFIKCFGFSFTVARLSMLPVAAGSTYLFYVILARFGINRWSAVLGTLLLSLSPLVFPLSFSFMTDIPGLFVVLLCLWLCQNAISAPSAAATVAWLSIATATNVVGGTVRQVAWLGALVMVPCAAIMLRKRKGVLLTGLCLFLASLISILALAHWFQQQPFSVPQKTFDPHISIHLWRHLADQLIRLAFVTLLMLLPVLLAWLWAACRRGSFALMRVFIFLGITSAVCLWLFHHGTLEKWLLPWLPHVLQSMGVAQSEIPEMLGARTVVLGLRLRLVITILTATSALACLDGLMATLLRLSNNSEELMSQSWRNIRWLLGPFSLAYLVLLFPLGIFILLFDRYAIVLFAVSIIVLLKIYQDTVTSNLPKISFAAVAIAAVFSIAATHDWFALDRARVAAANQVASSGFSRDQIQGGFDFDGWTQIENGGHINDARIKVPPNAFHPVLSSLELPAECQDWFADRTPSVHPKYYVSREPLSCFARTTYPVITYRAWLPPFHRQLYILQQK